MNILALIQAKQRRANAQEQAKRQSSFIAVCLILNLHDVSVSEGPQGPFFYANMSFRSVRKASRAAL